MYTGMTSLFSSVHMFILYIFFILLLLHPGYVLRMLDPAKSCLVRIVFYLTIRHYLSRFVYNELLLNYL